MRALMPADLLVERAALREQFRQAQRAHMEVVVTRARIVEDIGRSRELMARADFLLTWPYLIRPMWRDAPNGAVGERGQR